MSIASGPIWPGRSEAQDFRHVTVRAENGAYVPVHIRSGISDSLYVLSVRPDWYHGQPPGLAIARLDGARVAQWGIELDVTSLSPPHRAMDGSLLFGGSGFFGPLLKPGPLKPQWNQKRETRAFLARVAEDGQTQAILLGNRLNVQAVRAGTHGYYVAFQYPEERADGRLDYNRGSQNLIALNSDFTPRWHRKLQSNDAAWSYTASLVARADGGVLYARQSQIALLDRNGDLTAAYFFAPVRGKKPGYVLADALPAGGFVLATQIASADQTGTDLLIVWLDAQARIVRARTYDGGTNERLGEIVALPDGGLLAGGSIVTEQKQPNGLQPQLGWILEIDAGGTVKSSRGVRGMNPGWEAGGNVVFSVAEGAGGIEAIGRVGIEERVVNLHARIGPGATNPSPCMEFLTLPVRTADIDLSVEPWAVEAVPAELQTEPVQMEVRRSYWRSGPLCQERTTN